MGYVNQDSFRTPRAKKPVPTASIRIGEGDSLPDPVSGREAKHASVLYYESIIPMINTRLIHEGVFKQLAYSVSAARHNSSLPTIQKLAIELRAAAEIYAASNGVNGFALYTDAVNCAVRLAVAMMRRDDNGNMLHVCFEAETQFGKTIIEILAKIIYTMLVAHDENEIVVLINPSRDAPHKQTEEDYKGALELLSAMYVDKPGLDDDDIDESTVMNIMGEGRLNKMKGKQIAKRAVATPAIEMIDNAVAAGFDSITLMIDEGDEAAGTKSAIKSILKYTDRQAIRVRVVVITATAAIVKGLSNFTIVSVKQSDLSPDSIYCGLFICGAKGRLIPFFSQSMFDYAANLRGRLADFCIGKIGQYKDEQLEVIFDTFVAFSNGVFSPEMGLNGLPMNGKQGMMVRFGTTAHSGRLKRLFKDRLDDEGMLWIDFHTKTNGKTVVETIDAEILAHVRDQKLAQMIGENEDPREFISGFAKEPTPAEREEMSKVKYIIFVHGNGRRADRFPASTALFLDFTKNPAGSVAAEQGTMGRASGHGKLNSAVMLSEGGYTLVEAMREFYQTFGFKGVFKSAGPNAIKIDNDDGAPVVIKRKTMSRIIFDRRADWLASKPELLAIFDQLQTAYQPLMKWEYFDQRRSVMESDLQRLLDMGYERDREMQEKETAKGLVRIIGRKDGPHYRTVAGRRVSLIAGSAIRAMEGETLSQYFHLDPSSRVSAGKVEARSRTDVYFDIFGMLEADGRLQKLRDAARKHFGDNTIEFLRPLHNSPETGEPKTRDQVAAGTEAHYTDLRKKLIEMHPDAVNNSGEFYQSREGAIMLTLNNISRGQDASMRVYDDPTQRDRDRDLRHLLKPPMFFEEGARDENDQHTSEHTLLRFSLNTLRSFSTRAKAMGGSETAEHLSYPRPGTAFWDFTTVDEKQIVDEQIARNIMTKGRKA